MSDEYKVTLPGGATIPDKDGNMVHVDEGDTVDMDKVSDDFRRRVESGDPYALALFGREDDGNAVLDVSLNLGERKALEVAGQPVEERLGVVNRGPIGLDPGRTLPESGADIIADARFAASTQAPVIEPEDSGDKKSKKSS